MYFFFYVWHYFKACFKSLIISSACSKPTEIRINPPEIPVFRRSSSDSLACVVDAGCVTILLVSPKLADSDNIAEEFGLEIENASAVTQYDPILVGAGVEPYIIGSSFSLDIDEVSDLLKGNSGVFIVKLLSKDFATEVDLVQEISNSLTSQELERIATLIIEVIESKAEIVDNRSFYYWFIISSLYLKIWL